MSIKEIKGDLFAGGENRNFAHCVSRCFTMGKGIAVEFKKRFGNVQFLKSQNAPIGGFAFLKTDANYVFYLVTKEKYSGKPTYETLSLSLLNLRNFLLSNNIKEINMPRIGCGLDKLEWGIVKSIIYQVFEGTDININVYFL